MLKLVAPTRNDMRKVVEWRAVNPEGARTPYMLNIDQQIRWYDEVLCDRDSQHRYWSVIDENEATWPKVSSLVGFSGITYIDHENRRGEVALLVDPDKRGRGIGKQVLLLTLSQAFGNMDLEQVYGECYYCNKSLNFWSTLALKYGWETRVLPSVKRWGGKRWDALWFAISSETWNRMSDGSR